MSRLASRIIATPLALLLTAGAALAEDGNAALRYWRVWSLMDPSKNAAIAQVTPANLADPAWSPSDEQRAAAEQINPKLFLRASKAERCDFGVDLADGPMTLLPHLGPFRTSVVAVMVDARSQLQAGRTTEAVERIAAGYRAAHQILGDPSLVSRLVGMACFKAADAAAQAALASGKVSAEDRRTLADALSVFDGSDPFDLKGGIESERRDFLGWVRARVEAGDTPAIDAFMLAAGLDDNTRARARERLKDRAALAAALDRVDRAYALALAAWDAEDAGKTLAAIPAIGKGEDDSFFGLFLLPDFARMHARYVESRVSVSEARARVR